jgi:hypothetical protein
LKAFAIEDEGEEEIYSWEKDDGGEDSYVLMASCYTIANTSRGIEGGDCINGSLVPKGSLTDLTNFTYLLGLSAQGAVEKALDPTGRVAPTEMDLIIANESRLMINQEGCVNSLQNECAYFLREFGKDGTDHNARARFPCFYADHDPSFAITRYDLETTHREFLIAAIVPSVLFVVSCTCLVTCQKSVVVGDDAKMRFKGCGGKKALVTNPDQVPDLPQDPEVGGAAGGKNEEDEEEGAVGGAAIAL